MEITHNMISMIEGAEPRPPPDCPPVVPLAVAGPESGGRRWEGVDGSAVNAGVPRAADPSRDLKQPDPKLDPKTRSVPASRLQSPFSNAAGSPSVISGTSHGSVGAGAAIGIPSPAIGFPAAAIGVPATPIVQNPWKGVSPLGSSLMGSCAETDSLRRIAEDAVNSALGSGSAQWAAVHAPSARSPPAHSTPGIQTAWGAVPPSAPITGVLACAERSLPAGWCRGHPSSPSHYVSSAIGPPAAHGGFLPQLARATQEGRTDARLEVPSEDDDLLLPDILEQSAALAHEAEINQMMQACISSFAAARAPPLSPPPSPPAQATSL